jgi:hypothetical protein
VSPAARLLRTQADGGALDATVGVTIELTYVQITNCTAMSLSEYVSASPDVEGSYKAALM